MRYLAYLLAYVPVQLFAYLVTPLLPLFAVRRMGWCDNRNYEAFACRLPDWLAWFDTPDNSLDGDERFLRENSMGYWQKVRWLYRNSLYGFKWTALSAPLRGRHVFKTGANNLDYHHAFYGTQRLWTDDGYWQYKTVKPFCGGILVLNFGWLLDDASQDKALFLFSPRVTKIKGVPHDG